MAHNRSSIVQILRLRADPDEAETLIGYWFVVCGKNNMYYCKITTKPWEMEKLILDTGGTAATAATHIPLQHLHINTLHLYRIEMPFHNPYAPQGCDLCALFQSSFFSRSLLLNEKWRNERYIHSLQNF